jgi:hypothetical protein
MSSYNFSPTQLTISTSISIFYRKGIPENFLTSKKESDLDNSEDTVENKNLVVVL